MWKKKKVVDERIEKECNKLIAKQYYVVLGLLLVSLIVKMVSNLTLNTYVLEIIALVSMVSLVVIKEKSQGILFAQERDEVIETIHQSILAKGFYLGFYELIFGEVIVLFFLQEKISVVFTYFIIWMPSALIITVALIKKGLFVWGSEKSKVEGKSKFKKSVIEGAIIFGIIMSFPDFIVDGIQMKDIMKVVLTGGMWGILFYGAFTLMMKVGEKNADKLVEGKDGCEEQKDESSQNRM